MNEERLDADEALSGERLTDEEVRAVLALWAQRDAEPDHSETLDAGPRVKDVAAALDLSEGEAHRLLQEVRAQRAEEQRLSAERERLRIEAERRQAEDERSRLEQQRRLAEARANQIAEERLRLDAQRRLAEEERRLAQAQRATRIVPGAPSARAANETIGLLVAGCILMMILFARWLLLPREMAVANPPAAPAVVLPPPPNVVRTQVYVPSFSYVPSRAPLLGPGLRTWDPAALSIGIPRAITGIPPSTIFPSAQDRMQESLERMNRQMEETRAQVRAQQEEIEARRREMFQQTRPGSDRPEGAEQDRNSTP